jgi:hypothetical protein
MQITSRLALPVLACALLGGCAGGDRNDLSLKNEFTFVLERTAAAADDLPFKGGEEYKK